jgi:predicted Zn-dependent peptidase
MGRFLNVRNFDKSMGSLEGYREYRLDNGLVVALQNTPTQTVSAKLRVNFGSAHEREGEEGLAHFLEHCLVSGGSQKYSPESASEISGSFGYFNATTGIGRTFFEGQMLLEDLGIWLDYVSEHALKPRLDLERVNSERERVLREISDAKSNPTYLDNREYSRVFYRGHPRGKFNLGREEVVRNADQRKIREFHSRGFHPNNMDLLIAGKIPRNIEEIIREGFEGASAGKDTRRKFPEIKPLNGSTVIHRPAPYRYNADSPDESSAHLILTSIGPTESHADEYAFKTMSHILGGDATSLLFQNMSLKRGLAYSVNTSYDNSYNCGEWNAQANIPANRIKEAIDVFFEEIERIKTQPVTDEVLDRVKRKTKYHIARILESNEGHISVIEERLDKGLTPELFLENLNRVTPERVLEVANKYLPDEKGDYVLYIADPLKNQESQTKK